MVARTRLRRFGPSATTILMTSDNYHLQELSIAKSPGDPRRVMPTIRPEHRCILDVGCGAGQTLIASELAPGVTAVGVDVDSAALSLGRALGAGIRFARARGEALPFESESFDLVISRVALPYMNIPQALDEMRRVLKTGGDLWVVLHPLSLVMGRLAADLLRLKLKGVIYQLYVLTNGLALHLLGKQFNFPVTGGGCESFQTVGGIRRVLRHTGFEGVEIRRSNFFVVTAKKSPPCDPVAKRGARNCSSRRPGDF